MNNFLRALFLTAMLSLLSCSCMQAQDTNSDTPQAKDFGPAADFTLPDLNQRNISLSNYKDKNTVAILFWTTWCPYCLRALQDLNNLYPNLRKDGWEVLAINVGETQQKVANFIKRYNITFPVLLDEGGEAADSYGLLGVPTYFLVDKKGTIRFKQNYFPKDKYKQIIPE